MKNKLPAYSIVFTIMVLLNTNIIAQRQYFDSSTDLLLAQYDLRPDEDDVHSATAFGCMLRHEDMIGINYYAVAGAYGIQNGSFITPVIPEFFTMLFGDKNTHWTDAHNDRSGSINRVKNKIIATLNGGGKVFIAEGGQSDFTYDVMQALLTDGISSSVISSKIIVVQHSYRNEANDMATTSELNWVKNNTDYEHIDDGNSSDNSTPGYRTYTSSYMDDAKASNNPNEVARLLWTEADEICDNFTSSWENTHIADGGVDYSDHSEIWWILDQGTTANSISSFWDRYVTNSTGIVEGPGLPEPVPSTGGYKYGENYIVFEAEITKSEWGNWEIRREGDADYIEGSSGVGPINGTYLEFTGNGPSGGSANSPLVYTFTAPKTASYRLLARMLQNLQGAANDRCNDVYIRMSGDFESGGSFSTEDLQENLKFYGRGLDTWGNMYRGELESGWQQAMIYNLIAGEEYTFTVSGRSQRTCIDYFIFYETSISFNGVGEPSGGRNTDIAAVNDPEYLPDEMNLGSCNEIRAVDFDVFTDIDGFTDAEIDSRNGRQILSVPEALATSAAQFNYSGPDINVFFRINSMLETDGESTYRVLVNNTWVGEATNPRIYGTSTPNYSIATHQINYTRYPLHHGDIIQVEFNNSTNGLINEPGSPVGTATARGRWYSLEICDEPVYSPFPVLVDSIQVSVDELSLLAGDQSAIEVSIYPVNADNQNLTYTSTDTTVALVDNGNIVALRPGVVAITVAAEENGSINKVISVKVSAAATSEHIINYDRSEMIVIYASSENSDDPSRTHLKEDVLDGDPTTKWHSQWKPTTVNYPHEIWFDFNDTIFLDQLDYLPRHEGVNGIIRGYEVYISNDTAMWGDAIRTGELSWGDDPSSETLREIRSIILNETIQTRYLRLRFLSEINDNPWASMAEIYFKSYIDNIILSVGDTILQTGDELQLNAVINPLNDQTMFPVTWNTSDESIATVSDNGLVSCVTNGIVYITASILNDAIIDTCAIVVMNEGESIISIIENQLELVVDSTISLTAIAVPDTNTISWTSNQESVATVDNEGNVHAVAAGTAHIIAGIQSQSYTDTCTILVVEPEFNIIDEFDTIIVGEVSSISTLLTPPNATINWITLRPDIAQVMDGVIIAKHEGTTRIYGSIYDENFIDSISVTVIQPRVSINNAKDTLLVDEQIQLLATVSNSNDTVTWESSNNSIATISSDGIVQANSDGVVTISANIHSGKYRALKSMLVLAPEVNITDEARRLYTDRNIQLSALPVPDTAAVIWATSDSSIAIVAQNGVVRPVSVGEVTISASIMSGTHSDICIVDVVEPSINIINSGIILDEGTSLTLDVEAPDDEIISWSSTNLSIATVSESGVVHAIDSGYVMVYASILNGDYVDSCSITVNAVINGLQKNIQTHSMVYPNPTTGELFINTNKTISNIEVSDILGNLKYQANENDLLNKSINLSELKKGLYILTLTYSNNDIQLLKLLKN